MEQDRTESFASPLDEVLDNIPEEDPPADLERRCREALDAEASRTRAVHPRWYAPVRNVIAVAASLLLIVGTANLLMTTGGAHEKARMAPRLSSRAPAPAEEPAVGALAERAPQAMAEPAPQAQAAYTEAPPPPSPPSAPGEDAARAVDAVSAHGLRLDETEVAQTPGAAELRSPMGGVITSTPAVSGPSRAPEVEDPWRDLSGERQVITHKEMEIEVADVERAYDDARAIVEKHGGFVASDRVSIAEDQRDSAHLTIRLPVGSFESAITDLRQLGEVVRLVGESVDVTEEYYTRGAETRAMADREQALVEKYEAETNPARRRQLKAQLDRLRAELKREKEILTDLAEQTHWPVLELVLSENAGPGGFFARMLSGSLTALAWVGATAVIWLPIVVLLTLFWRRITPVAPRSES